MLLTAGPPRPRTVRLALCLGGEGQLKGRYHGTAADHAHVHLGEVRGEGRDQDDGTMIKPA